MFKKLTNIAASLAIVLSIVAPASAASVTLTSKVANVTKGSVWANQTTASAGDSLSYLMTLRNETGSPVTNLMARVQLPAEISYVSGSAIFVYRDASGKDVTTAVADGLVSGNGVTLPNIPALNQIYVAYKAKVNSGFTSGTWFAPSNQIKADGFSLSSNDARVTLSGQDPQPQPTVSAQLDTYLYNLTKNVRTYTQSVEAERGDELIYRVTIRNTGNTTLTNTGFKVEIPAGLEFVDGYSRFYYGDGFENIGLSANIVSAGGVALMDIPAQTYRYVTYKVKVSSNASAGIYATSNKFQANNRAVNISDNGGRVNVKVASDPEPQPQPQPTVSAQLDTYLYNLTKNVRTYTQSVEAERGDELIYRVTIRNTGNTTLTNTGFKVEVPAGLEFVDGYSRFYYGDGFENIGLSANIVSAGGVALMDIPAQTYRYVTYKVKVSSNASAGIYATSNKFQANNRAVNISDNGGRVNVKVAGQPSVTRILSLSAKAFNGTSYANSISVKRGDAVKFRVDFKNDGSQDLSNIRITNSLPANMTYVAGSMKVVLGSATISTSDSVFNAGINLGSLTVGQNGYMEFSAKVNSDTADNVTQLVYTATGNADNTAQISSLVTINLAKDGVLPDTGTPGSIASLILLAMFIAIASYIYFKETNGLNKVLSIIKK